MKVRPRASEREIKKRKNEGNLQLKENEGLPSKE